MTRWNPRSPWLVGMLLSVVLALVTAACAGGNDSAESVDSKLSSQSTVTTLAGSATTAPSSAAPRDGFAPGTDSGEFGSVEPVIFQTTSFGRDIIFTAEMTVAVTDVGVAGDTAVREIAALGGILFGQRTTGGPNPVSVLTFKVEPADFSDALDRLGEIGEVRAQNVSASDVTERIVDLESRILSAEASVERLRELLSSAGGVAVVVQVETELLQRETQLETLRGQLRTLEDQVSLATIVVTLTEAEIRPGIDLVVTAYPGHDGVGLSCHGEPGLAVDEGNEATLCFEIVNTGDTPLTDFELVDPVLDITLDDLTPVLGEAADTLEPGERVMFALEIVAERDLRTQSRVGATPLNQEGEPLSGRTVASTATISISALDPGGVPGFSEGLSASLGFLADAGRVLILSLGVALPFLWLAPLVAWLYVRWRRRDRALVDPAADDPLGATG